MGFTYHPGYSDLHIVRFDTCLQGFGVQHGIICNRWSSKTFRYNKTIACLVFLCLQPETGLVCELHSEIILVCTVLINDISIPLFRWILASNRSLYIYSINFNLLNFACYLRLLETVGLRFCQWIDKISISILCDLPMK